MKSPSGTEANAVIGVSVAVVWADPTAVRPVDAPAIASSPQTSTWIARLDVDLQLDLLGRVSTQALLGEPVIVIDERDGWSEVRLPWQPSSLSAQGYPGWVRSAHLVPLRSGHDDGGRMIVKGSLRTSARADDGTHLELSFGTILSTAAERGKLTVLRHPDGATIVADSAAVDRFDHEALLEPGEAAHVESHEILDMARLFLDMPYLWSGMSGGGVDCSGFVHLVYRAAGLRVARDAHDQAVQGDPLELEDAEPGDPVFFENERGVHHVGLVTSPGQMLHSPRTGRSVGTEPISSPHYRGERVTSRKFIPRSVTIE